MVARAGRKSRLEQLEKAPCAVERMMVVPHRRVVQFARALAKRAGGHTHENLLESYSCRGRVAQLGEHLLCKQGVAGSSPVTSTKFPVREIRLSLPNKHYLLVDLKPFGMDNPGEVFLPTDEPHGLIVVSVHKTSPTQTYTYFP